MKKIILYLLIIILFFLSGFSLAFFIYKNKYQEGWNAAITRIENSHLCEEFNDNAPTFSISGIIKSINDNSINVDSNFVDPLEDPSLDSRVVTADNNTKIFQITNKDPKTYQQEVNDFYKTRGKYKDDDEFFSNMPRNMVQTEIGYKDLKVGQKISVTSGVNIRNSKTIVANEIIVQ